MARITWIVLYQRHNYVSYQDSAIRTDLYYGCLNQEAMMDCLRRDGAEQVSVIVVNNNPMIPVLRKVKEFCKAGYTCAATPIGDSMTYWLRRIKADERF